MERAFTIFASIAGFFGAVCILSFAASLISMGIEPFNRSLGGQIADIALLLTLGAMGLGLIFGLVASFFYSQLPQVTHGIVIRKDHAPAHTTTLMPPVGKAVVPTIQYHPERWTLIIKDGQDEGSVSVSEDIYNHVEIGDRW